MKHTQIVESLIRQREGMKILSSLLKEEFSALTARDKSGLVDMELAVQELIRQLARERDDLKAALSKVMPGGQGLSQFIDRQAPDSSLKKLVADMELLERQCSRQATVNADLVMALVQQSQDMLSFMHDQVRPRNEDVYSRRGDFAADCSEPRLLQGRL